MKGEGRGGERLGKGWEGMGWEIGMVSEERAGRGKEGDAVEENNVLKV